MTTTKLSPAMAKQMWQIVIPGTYRCPTILPLAMRNARVATGTRVALIERKMIEMVRHENDMFSDWRLTDAGSAWIAKQISIDWTDALEENLRRTGGDAAAVNQALRLLGRAGHVMGFSLIEHDHASALHMNAAKGKLFSMPPRDPKDEAAWDQWDAWRNRCADRGTVHPDDQAAADHAEALRMWRHESCCKTLAEAVEHDEAEAHMEQDLADQFARVTQAQRWLDRHGIQGRRTDVMRAMGDDHAEATKLNKLPADERAVVAAIPDGWELLATVRITDADRAMADQFKRSQAAHANCAHEHQRGGDYEHDHWIAAKINDALTGWQERHTDCGHPLDPRTLLACDYDEAYRITAELIEA